MGSETDCKVYIWKRWFSPGHIALELPNKMYISFWPRPKGRKSVLTASGTKYSRINDEIRANGDPSKTLSVPGLDVQKISMWWTSLAEDNPRWNLASFNCSTTVFEALCEGSDWFKDKESIMPNTPAGIADLVQTYINEQLGVESSPSPSGCILM